MAAFLKDANAGAPFPSKSTDVPSSTEMGASTEKVQNHRYYHPTQESNQRNSKRLEVRDDCVGSWQVPLADDLRSAIPFWSKGGCVHILL